VPLVEQELPTLPEHLGSSLVFSEVRVTWSLVLCTCFVDPCLSFCTFSFGHCLVCPFSIYRFWLPLWYFQTLLTVYSTDMICSYQLIALDENTISSLSVGSVKLWTPQSLPLLKNKQQHHERHRTKWLLIYM
jgi:hypothetical protein